MFFCPCRSRFHATLIVILTWPVSQPWCGYCRKSVAVFLFVCLISWLMFVALPFQRMQRWACLPFVCWLLFSLRVLVCFLSAWGDQGSNWIEGHRHHCCCGCNCQSKSRHEVRHQRFPNFQMASRLTDTWALLSLLSCDDVYLHCPRLPLSFFFYLGSWARPRLTTAVRVNHPLWLHSSNRISLRPSWRLVMRMPWLLHRKIIPWWCCADSLLVSEEACCFHASHCLRSFLHPPQSVSVINTLVDSFACLSFVSLHD